jgi:hypothetical protein
MHVHQHLGEYAAEPEHQGGPEHRIVMDADVTSTAFVTISCTRTPSISASGS